jgi:hypothetical protein
MEPGDSSPMTDAWQSSLMMLPVMVLVAAMAFGQDAEVIFAVVTKVPKDRRHVTAQVSVGGTVTEATLIPSEQLLENLIWKRLEICHSLKAESVKTAEGYRISEVKVLDAGMLPMTLQGLAGDCLLKKALEFAPQID